MTHRIVTSGDHRRWPLDAFPPRRREPPFVTQDWFWDDDEAGTEPERETATVIPFVRREDAPCGE